MGCTGAEGTQVQGTYTTCQPVPHAPLCPARVNSPRPQLPQHCLSTALLAKLQILYCTLAQAGAQPTKNVFNLHHNTVMMSVQWLHAILGPRKEWKLLLPCAYQQPSTLSKLRTDAGEVAFLDTRPASLTISDGASGARLLLGSWHLESSGLDAAWFVDFVVSSFPAWRSSKIS